MKMGEPLDSAPASKELRSYYSHPYKNKRLDKPKKINDLSWTHWRTEVAEETATLKSEETSLFKEICLPGVEMAGAGRNTNGNLNKLLKAECGLV